MQGAADHRAGNAPEKAVSAWLLRYGIVFQLQSESTLGFESPSTSTETPKVVKPSQ